ncbi:MAG: thioredoxin family protein [Bacteroidales bacterium]
MIKIKILGSGCARCESLYKLTQTAVEDLHIDATVEKVGDIQEILKYTVMRTPALIIDEKVILTGEVPALTTLKSLLYNVSQNQSK